MKRLFPAEKALSYFDSEYNCAQSVFKSLLEHKGLHIDDATYLASGFGGGISFSGQQCGAISGAMMAIGLFVARNIRDVKKHKSVTHDLSAQLMKKFRAEFGHIRCDDLTGIDMSNKDAFTKAYDSGVFKETCPKFVAGAVRIVLEMFPD